MNTALAKRKPACHIMCRKNVAEELTFMPRSKHAAAGSPKTFRTKRSAKMQRKTRGRAYTIFPKASKRPLGSAIPAQFIDAGGLVSFADVAKWFGMSKRQLASTVG